MNLWAVGRGRKVVRSWWWLAIVAACCLLPAARTAADTRFVEHPDDPLRVIQMEVTPADEPSPAFKHRLTFGPHERVPGNRPQWYVRAFPENSSAIRAWRDLISDDEFDAYYLTGTPIGELPLKGFDRGVRHADLVDDFITPGAQRRDCDWGIRTENLSGPETYQFLLPEFQSMRAFSRMNSLMTRYAIAQGRYDDAIDYLRAHYQMARDVGSEPILVPGLIGIAIGGIASGNTLDLIAAPGSPNLYWALSELPSPPVSLEEAVRNELAIGRRLYPFLDDPEHADRSADEWNGLWKQHAGVIGDAVLSAGDHEEPDAQQALLNRALPVLSGIAGYGHAKRRLVEWGFDADAVEAMAVGQVLAVYSSRAYDIIAGEHLKAYLAPYARRGDFDADHVSDLNHPLSGGVDRELIPIATYWLPTMRAAKSAEVRSARELAALRVIEALRMHAARNDGRWPTSLEDVTCVPVPLNPATDKPFLYHRDGNKAVLDLPDWEVFPGQSRRYEITLKP